MTVPAARIVALRQRHGSVEGYLADEAGVGPEVIGELRARLVRPEGPVG